MMKRLVAVLLLGLAATALFAPPAYAHGERSQEAFLRMRTVGWQDVTFTGGERNQAGDIVIAQGEKVKVTGTAKLMNTWPDTLAAGQPEIGFINIATQGPAIGMLERTINGVSAPGRLEITRGNFYDFDFTLMGRRAGRWHVHPTFAVKGAGTLLGPGEWIVVEKAKGGYTSPVALYNGQTINLENYGLNFVWSWQVLGFLIGLAWMIYWTVPSFHRTVANLAVTSQIPLNDDGVAVGLNSKKDHRVVNIFALVTALMLLAGWIYQAAEYPVKIPQQVVQFQPPLTARDKAPPMAEVNPTKATYDSDSQRLTLAVNVKNINDQPIDLTAFTTSTLTFVNGTNASGAYVSPLKVSPSGSLQPGQDANMTLELPGDVFEQEHLVPVGESQLTVAGLLIFKDAAGRESTVEMEEPLQPRFKG